MSAADPKADPRWAPVDTAEDFEGGKTALYSVSSKRGQCVRSARLRIQGRVGFNKDPMIFIGKRFRAMLNPVWNDDEFTWLEINDI
jgi:hypothetical protein